MLITINFLERIMRKLKNKVIYGNGKIMRFYWLIVACLTVFFFGRGNNFIYKQRLLGWNICNYFYAYYLDVHWYDFIK